MRVVTDFIDGLPYSRSGYVSLWVIIDRLTKSAHFLPIRSNRTVRLLAKLYVSEIVKLYGVHLKLINHLTNDI